jgi:hypothetical protein
VKYRISHPKIRDSPHFISPKNHLFYGKVGGFSVDSLYPAFQIGEKPTNNEGRADIMATLTKEVGDKKINCQRCGGKMIFEKFYDVNNIFFGWHCVICGEILDPVILLHRLSQNADLQIPEGQEEILHLLKKYMQSKPKKAEAAKA